VPLLEDDGIGADLATALQTTLATGFGFNHSLCHGDLGNLDCSYKAVSHPDSDILKFHQVG
jgi:lantibiotic modifying enzyme